MMEIAVRDALPADVPFLRDALAKLNDEMETLSGAAGFRAEGFPGQNIEGCLQRNSFLIAVADKSRAVSCRSTFRIRHQTEHWFGPDRWQ